MASNSAFVEFVLTNFGRVLTKLAQDIYWESIGPGFFLYRLVTRCWTGILTRMALRLGLIYTSVHLKEGETYDNITKWNLIWCVIVQSG